MDKSYQGKVPLSFHLCKSELQTATTLVSQGTSSVKAIAVCPRRTRVYSAQLTCVPPTVNFNIQAVAVPVSYESPSRANSTFVGNSVCWWLWGFGLLLQVAVAGLPWYGTWLCHCVVALSVALLVSDLVSSLYTWL